MRYELWIKALNSVITNEKGTDKTSRYVKIVNGKHPTGLTKNFINSDCCLVVPVIAIAKINEDGTLTPHNILKNDIFVINKYSKNLPYISVNKLHNKIKSKYIKVKEGDEIRKGDSLAYNKSPRYIKKSKVSGKIISIMPDINSLDESVIQIQNEYRLNMDGIKLIGVDAMKGTTQYHPNRFKVKLNTTERLASFIKLLNENEYPITYLDKIEEPVLICDLVSILRREAWNFLEELKITTKNGRKGFCPVSIIDNKTGEEYVGIYGIACFTFGEQTPDYELKTPGEIHPQLGFARNVPSIDIFSRYVIRSKYGKDIEKMVSDYLNWITFDDESSEDDIEEDPIYL